METRQTINKEINVTAWYFRNKHERVTSFPKRIECEEQEYTFLEGLRFLIQKGKRAVQLFDMTDGNQNYRLQFDTEAQSWTLLSISHPSQAF